MHALDPVHPDPALSRPLPGATKLNTRLATSAWRPLDGLSRASGRCQGCERDTAGRTADTAAFAIVVVHADARRGAALVTAVADASSLACMRTPAVTPSTLWVQVMSRRNVNHNSSHQRRVSEGAQQ